MKVSNLNSLVELYFKKLEEIDPKKQFLKWLKPGKPHYTWEDITKEFINFHIKLIL